MKYRILGLKISKPKFPFQLILGRYKHIYDYGQAGEIYRQAGEIYRQVSTAGETFFDGRGTTGRQLRFTGRRALQAGRFF